MCSVDVAYPFLFSLRDNAEYKALFPSADDQLDLPTLVQRCRLNRYALAPAVSESYSHSYEQTQQQHTLSYTTQAMNSQCSAYDTQRTMPQYTPTATAGATAVTGSGGLALLFEDLFHMIDNGKRFNQHNCAFQVR